MAEEARIYPYMGHVLRKITPYFTKFFIESRVSANQVSLFSILFGVVGGFSLVSGDYYLMLVGCIVFYQLWNLFDCVDGEVARVTKDMSLGGRYLEGIHNPIIESGFVACFGIGLFRMLGGMIFLYSGFIFALSICLLHDFNRTRKWITVSLGRKEVYVSPLMGKVSIIGRFYRGLYRKVRLLFLLPNSWLILAGILVFQMLFPIKISYTLHGVTLNLLSAYFLLYGFDWLIRTVVSGATNYRYLMRMQKEVGVDA